MPNNWRIDTFMSGTFFTSCTAAVIDPPWLRVCPKPLLWSRLVRSG
jgi:hypothetical protein